MSDQREVLGFAAAPLPLAIPFVAIVSLSLVRGDSDAATGASFLFPVILFDYVVTLGLGIPIHMVLRRIGRRDLSCYLVAAFAVGLPIGLAVVFPMWIYRPDPRNPFVIRIPPYAPLVPAGLSMIPAAVFWFVAVRPRPMPPNAERRVDDHMHRAHKSL